MSVFIFLIFFLQSAIWFFRIFSRHLPRVLRIFRFKPGGLYRRMHILEELGDDRGFTVVYRPGGRAKAKRRSFSLSLSL